MTHASPSLKMTPNMTQYGQLTACAMDSQILGQLSPPIKSWLDSEQEVTL